MRDKVFKAIADYSLVNRGDKVIVALSGGADSVALMCFLNSIKEEYNLTLYACHVNHMIRNEEADRDESFVRALCDELGVELFCEKFNVPEISQKEKTSLELTGRKVRYDYFEMLSKKLGAKVATAHTSSDNVETVLYNMARGTSLTGLCGIKAVRDYVIRPLIYCSRADIEQYCADNQLSFVTDSTNLTDDYTRNNIRHNVVPVLSQFNEDLCTTVNRMCNSLLDIKTFIDNYSIKEINASRTEYGYSCDKLLMLDKAILRNSIYLICKENGVDATQKHIELICSALSECGCVDLGFGKRAVCKQSTLRIVDTNECVQLPECKFKDYTNKEFISVSEIKNINKNFLNNCINCDIITDDTVIRTRREGDTFTFCNRGITKSLKKLMNEMKIPYEKRSSLLIVANGSTVLWIEGVGVSKQGMITNKCSGAFIIYGG